MLPDKVLRPDSKGRISLGKLARGVSSYRVTVDDQRRIVLEPFAEIPLAEKWLFEDPAARDSLERGLADAREGRVVELGSFAEYADEG
jgi:hypothetical protein